MTPKHTPPQPVDHSRQKTRDRQRTRAVLREGELRDRQYSRAKKRLRLDLTPDEASARPLLAQHLEVSGNFPPNTKRSAASRTRQLHAMFDAYGPLVFLRFALPALDAYALHDKDLPALARDALSDKVWGLVDNDAPHTVDIHRGAEGGTHAHMVTPLCFILDESREQVDAAPHGIRGGLELSYFAGHAVVMGNTSKDRERVAAYVRCHPDARLKEPGTPAYLDALEDELRRKGEGLRFGRLGWDGGGVRGL